MDHNQPYLLDYYELKRPRDVNMVHRVNSRERFERYIDDPNVHMLEVDLEGTDSPTDDIVLQHGGLGDVPVISALKQLVRHKKALKLDLKLLKGDPYVHDFYSHVFDLVREHWDPQIPIWINADVVNGTNCEHSGHKCLDAGDFIRLYNTYYQDNPNAMLSLGFLTGRADGVSIQPYDSQMLREMREVITGTEGSVTIALRYTNLMVDMSLLEEFLKLGSVTIWNSEDRVSDDQFHQLAERVQSLDVFKDLTGLNGEPLWDGQ